MTAARRDESGLVRGCCLGLIAGVALVGFAGFVAVRALTRPDLGPGPSGSRHGGTPEAIAAAMAAELSAALVARPHATAVLSERDLTVVARARNPDPARFRDPDARVRDGRVVVSAGTSLGPFDTVTVARTAPRLQTEADGQPHLAAEVTGVELGSLSIPDWARHTIDPRGGGILALDPVLDSAPAMAVLRASLDCIGVGSDGLHVGVHRPGSPAEPAGCSG